MHLVPIFCAVIFGLFILNFSLSLPGASSVGVNPKINNIYEAYEAAHYNLLWISDSNIISKLANKINK